MSVVVYANSWKGYHVTDVKHYQANHSKFADDENHINGIENSRSQAKCHIRQFNGVPKAQFGLYLKKCE